MGPSTPARLTSSLLTPWAKEWRAAAERIVRVRGVMMKTRIGPPVRLIGALLVILLAVTVALTRPQAAQAGGAPGHAPIVIHSDSDFSSCACVVSGSGTPTDPYVIGPWAINGAPGVAVSVDGATLTKSFTFLNLTIGGSNSAATTGIVLNHINPGSGAAGIAARVQGAQTLISNHVIGVLIENSRYVVLDGGGANPNGLGIVNSGAGTINQNSSGAIDVEDSSYITIRGWQMSADGTDHATDWVGLDPDVKYWGVGGVRFFGVNNSTIDHNAANNVTNVSYSLFHSSHNTLTSNTGDYPLTMNFVITDGSSYNTVRGNDGGTGDYIGLMIADPLQGTPALSAYGPSHDNVVDKNIIHGDGPTGNERMAGTVPAFLGGIVVLNGTYNNTLSNNQLWADAGNNLVWAQAVPNSQSVIGVVTAPPLLHCNVNQYNGGPGPAPYRNGNVWTGNIYQTIDPCLQ